MPEKQNAQQFHCTDDAQEKLDKLDKTSLTYDVEYVAKGFEMVKACNDRSAATRSRCGGASAARRLPTSDVMNYCISEQAQPSWRRPATRRPSKPPTALPPFDRARGLDPADALPARADALLWPRSPPNPGKGTTRRRCTPT